MTYRIRDWETHFENHESRKVKGVRWVAVPNKHDGKGYRRIAQHPEGVQIFCAWTLMLQVASKMPERGVLADEDGALDADDLSAMTGFPAAIFDAAFKLLSTQKIAWIEEVPADSPVLSRPAPSRSVPKSPAVTGKTALEGKGREQNGTEGKRSGADAPAATPEFTVLGYLQHLKTLPAYDHIDPVVEESKIRVWHERAPNQNRALTKRFLENWVNKVERPLAQKARSGPVGLSPPKPCLDCGGSGRATIFDPDTDTEKEVPCMYCKGSLANERRNKAPDGSSRATA